MHDWVCCCCAVGWLCGCVVYVVGCMLYDRVFACVDGWLCCWLVDGVWLVGWLVVRMVG